MRRALDWSRWRKSAKAPVAGKTVWETIWAAGRPRAVAARRRAAAAAGGAGDRWAGRRGYGAGPGPPFYPRPRQIARRFDPGTVQPPVATHIF